MCALSHPVSVKNDACTVDDCIALLPLTWEAVISEFLTSAPEITESRTVDSASTQASPPMTQESDTKPPLLPFGTFQRGISRPAIRRLNPSVRSSSSYRWANRANSTGGCDNPVIMIGSQRSDHQWSWPFITSVSLSLNAIGRETVRLLSPHPLSGWGKLNSTESGHLMGTS